MTETEAQRPGLTDAVKASVVHAGLVTQLKNAMQGSKPTSDNDLYLLRKDAQAMTEALQQLLDGGRLDDANSQKIGAMLSRLKGVLTGGHVSREALAMVLSEAASAMGTAEGSGKSNNAATIEQLWQKVDAYNKEIDDDFEKMRKAGILFDEKLWNNHLRLSEYLKTHPRDIERQKELDAVDDALLLQAEPQLKEHPAAKFGFDDAKAKSKDRHQTVDHALAATDKRATLVNGNSDMDWDAPSSQEKINNGAAPEDVTMNDVKAPTLSGTADKNSSKSFVRKQTKVCFRTKKAFHVGALATLKSRKSLKGAALRDNHSGITMAQIAVLVQR